MIRQFDERQGWGEGVPVLRPLAELAYETGTGAARKKERVTHVLGKLPKMSAAVQRRSL